MHRFSGIDITDNAQRQRLIDGFVNAIYLDDDKIVLMFNYKDGSKTITLEDIAGSDLVGGFPPKSKASERKLTNQLLINKMNAFLV